jgi:peptidoglycan/LPS O-acetylase OafA/YrhL
VLLGRWSLSYYLLHQPVLLAAMAGTLWLVR